MTSNQKAQQIITDIDESNEILTYKLNDGFIIWLQIRYQVYKLLIQEFEKVEPGIPVHSYNNSKWQKIRYYWLTLFKHNALLVKQKYTGLIFSSNLATLRNEESGQYESRVNYCFNRLPDVHSLFFSNGSAFRLPYNGSFSFADSLYLMARMDNLISSFEFKKEEYEKVDLLLIFLRGKIGKVLSETKWIELRDVLNQFYRNYFSINRTIGKLFANTKPKYIVVEDGNYGGGIITQIIFCANKLNIATIEVQHGILDIAYQYGTKLISTSYFNFHKTQYLLTFGKFWFNQLKSSTVGVDIGNCYLDNIQRKLNSTPNNTVLFISQGSITEFLVRIALTIASSSDFSYRIVYCLHPNEMGNLDKYSIFNKFENIKLGYPENIYDLMAKCDFVIGSYSAALFDALLFGKQVFVHKNQYSDEFIPNLVAQRFLTPDDLISLIKENKGKSISQISELFFTPECEENFSRFIKTANLK